MIITEADVNKIVINAVKPYVPACAFGAYAETDETYCYFILPPTETVQNGDDDAVLDMIPIQLHLFTKSNYSTLRKQIKLSLKKAGFTKPNVTCLYENDTQLNHIIFECEIIVASEKE